VGEHHYEAVSAALFPVTSVTDAVGAADRLRRHYANAGPRRSTSLANSISRIRRAGT